MNNPIHRQRIMKCGWLRKQGGMVKTWHRRWFCLNGDCLFYFSKEDDLRPLGTIFLPGNRIVEQPFNPDEPEKFLMEIFPGTIQPKMAPNHDTFLLWAASNDERDGWIKAIRKVMHSPFGGAIFGQSLEDTMAHEYIRGRTIPYIVTHCVQFLEKHGTEVEGIFRLAGRASLIKELRDKFDCAERVEFDISEVDVHTVASLLKLFLRELPDSLIPSKMYQCFMNIALRFQDANKPAGKLEAVADAKIAVGEIPKENYNVLKYLCKFFFEVGQKSDINKMTHLNLAVVLGPNVIRNITEVNTPELLMATADLTQQLAFMLICNQETLFDKEISNVPTVDDLLNLDDTEDIPSPFSTLDSKTSPHLMDLEGIDFIDGEVEKPVPLPRSNSSDVFDKSTESISSTDTTSSTDQNVSTSSSNITLVGLSNIQVPSRPIPPKRRSKMASLKRGRRVSDRSKGETPPMSPTFEPDRILDNGESTSMNGSYPDFKDLPGDRTSIQGSIEGEKISKMRAEIRELNSRLENMKSVYEKQISDLKSGHEKEISDLRCQETALKSQIATMKSKFEQRLAEVNTRHKADVTKLCEKIATEKVSTTEAVKKVMSLQAELELYQSKFGKIPKS